VREQKRLWKRGKRRRESCGGETLGQKEREREELVNNSRACNARTSQASELNQKILCSKG
jgi:hypothetical protein